MTDACTPYEALKAAVERLGSQAALARVCGVSQPAAWKWVQSSKRLPPEHVLAVEAATGVSRHDLRPDIYPREPSAPFDATTVIASGRIVPCDRPAISKRRARA